MLLLLVVTFVCKYGVAVNNNGTSGKTRQLGKKNYYENYKNLSTICQRQVVLLKTIIKKL